MSWRVPVVVFILAVARDAGADDAIKNADAKAHYDSANAYYNAGNFDAAIVELSEAYSLEPQPVILYAWAQAERKRGHCDQAIPLYKRYIDQGVTASQKEAALTNVDRCTRAQLNLPPPEETKPSESIAAPPPVQVDEPSPWYRDRVGNILAGSGVVLLGAGGGLFALSLHEKSKATDATTVSAYGDAIEAARRDRFISIGCFAVGAALVTAGIVHYRHHGRSRSVDVSAFVTGGGGGLALAAGF